MKNIFPFLRSLLSYILLIPILAVTLVPAVIMLLILPKSYLHDNRLYFWLMNKSFVWGLRVSFIPIKIMGKRNIPKSPAVFVANHQSSLDIPLLGSLVGSHSHVWLAWASLVKYPFLGLILRHMAVLVDMSSPQKGMRSLIEAINRIKENGRHVLMFPEGGRYTDGKVHDFFSGFVILARRTGRPVVPVMLVNAGKAYPPHTFVAHWYPIKVIVGEPFDFKNDETDDEFKNRVYAWFVVKNNE